MSIHCTICGATGKSRVAMRDACHDRPAVKAQTEIGGYCSFTKVKPTHVRALDHGEN